MFIILLGLLLDHKIVISEETFERHFLPLYLPAVFTLFDLLISALTQKQFRCFMRRLSMYRFWLLLFTLDAIALFCFTLVHLAAMKLLIRLVRISTNVIHISRSYCCNSMYVACCAFSILFYCHTSFRMSVRCRFFVCLLSYRCLYRCSDSI